MWLRGISLETSGSGLSLRCGRPPLPSGRTSVKGAGGEGTAPSLRFSTTPLAPLASWRLRRGREVPRPSLPFLHHPLGSTGELEFQARLSRRLKIGVDSEVAALLEDSDA